MRPIIADIPLPFELFGHDSLPIRGFGLMVVLGLLAGNWIATRLARRDKISEDVMANVFLVFVLAIMVGARALYVVVNWGRYVDDPLSVFAFHRGGMVYYGSFLAVIIALPFYLWRARAPILKVLDVYAVGAGLGMSLGRVGCLLVGDDFGRPVGPSFPRALAIKFSTLTEPGSFLGITIPPDNGNLAAPLQGQWLHPTQPYMSLNALMIFFVLRWLWGRKQFDGQVAAAFCMIYAITRSIIEVFRGDDGRGYVGPLSTSQFVSIFVFLGGAALYWTAHRRRAARP